MSKTNEKAQPSARQAKGEQAAGDKVIAVNRRARHDYDILETLEAGLVLTGTEIKSVRSGHASLQEAFARRVDREVWLYGMHIPPYAQGNIYNHDPTRPRKLLLNRDQILALTHKVEAKGLTLVPLKLYITRHRAKIELGVARGRKIYDKREAIARREVDREMQRAMRVRA